MIQTIFALLMVYRFKIWFDDIDDVYRWIEIKPSHTFLDLNNIIQESIGFDDLGDASFFISDDRWRRNSEIIKTSPATKDNLAGDESTSLMAETKIRSCINDPHQRFIYVFDNTAQWTLFCELISIEESSGKHTYPRVYRTEGKAPRQHNEGKFNMLDDNEFDTLAEKILAAKGVKSLLVEHEEEMLAILNKGIVGDVDDDVDDDIIDDVDHEEEEDAEDHDEFGFGALSEGIDPEELK